MSLPNITRSWREILFRGSGMSQTLRGISLNQILSEEGIFQGSAIQYTSLLFFRWRLTFLVSLLCLINLVTACMSTSKVGGSKGKMDGQHYIHPISIDGRVYMDSKEYSAKLVKAERVWQEKQKKGVRNSSQLMSYKIALRKYKAAESLARFNLLLDYRDEESLYFLAVAHFMQGRIKHAKAILTPMLSSKNIMIKSQASNALGIIAWHRKNWEEALKYFDLAVTYSRFNSGALLNRAVLALSFNDPTRAENLLREISLIEGVAYDDARFHLAVAYSLEGKEDEAIASLKGISGYKNNPIIMLNLAVIYYNSGDDEEAASHLKNYIKISSSKTIDSRRAMALSEGLRLRKSKKPLTNDEIRKLATSKNALDDDEDNSLSIMTNMGGVPMD